MASPPPKVRQRSKGAGRKRKATVKLAAVGTPTRVALEIERMLEDVKSVNDLFRSACKRGDTKEIRELGTLYKDLVNALRQMAVSVPGFLDGSRVDLIEVQTEVQRMGEGVRRVMERLVSGAPGKLAHKPPEEVERVLRREVAHASKAIRESRWWR